MNETVRTSDLLEIKMAKAAEVYCVACKEHIAWAKEDFKLFAVDRLIPANQEQPIAGLGCPACGKTFAALKGSVWKIKTNKGYLP